MSMLASVMAGVMVRSSNLEWSKKNPSSTSSYKGGNYCGPGWGFTYRDILEGKIRDLPPALDAIDEACKAHDYCYTENGYFTQGCNLVLSYDLLKVVKDPKSTGQQRIDAVIMAAIFLIESQTIDLGVLAKKDAIEIKNRILGFLSQANATLEAAIKREISARSGGMWIP